MIIKELFQKRLSAFYSSWRTTHKQLWRFSDIIVVSTPGDFFLWLLGEEVAGTTAVFTPSSILFVCTQDSFSALHSLRGGYAMAMGVNIPISVELKPMKGDSKKLDGIIRGLDTYTSIVGCTDDDEYFSGEYMIAGVNRGVRELIGDSTSNIDDDDILLGNNNNNSNLKRRLQLKLKLQQRLTFLYSSWRKYRKKLWGDSNILLVTTRLPSCSGSKLDHPVSSSFFVWLLGRDFPNTTALFMDKAIYFFCPLESYGRLLYLQLYMTTEELPVSVRPKLRSRAYEGVSKLLNSLTLYDDATAVSRRTRTRTSHPVVIGYIDGEPPNSMGFLHSCCGNSDCDADETRFQGTNVISGFVKLLLNGDIAENYGEQLMSLSLSWSSSASSMVSSEEEDDDDYDDEVLHVINKKLQKKKKGHRVSSFSWPWQRRRRRASEQVVLAEKEQEVSESCIISLENAEKAIFDDDWDWEII